MHGPGPLRRPKPLTFKTLAAATFVLPRFLGFPRTSAMADGYQHTETRRTFLKQSAGVAALGALAVPRAVHADGDGGGVLKLGLIGCGGRGTGAVVDALRADPLVALVAVGDTFADRAQQSLDQLRKQEEISSRIKVTPDNIFPAQGRDFDSYKHVIDSGVDVVILATPPHFRPQHLAYAVEKGKHCFVEKPVGVDIPGVKSVEESCAKAKEKNLAIATGLCWRSEPGVIETINRIRDGAIGDIIAIQSCYNAGLLWHRGDEPSWSRMEYQIRNWLYYTWLSGDHIVEQAIHSLDKVNWLMGDASPESAFGMGGRQQRTDKKFGNIFDHHAVFFEYPNGVKAFFTCRQQENVMMNVDELVLGTKGSAQVLAKRIDGPEKWRYRADSKKPADMYKLEHVHMFESIRAGSPLNQGHIMCNSTRVAIMGRMCTYTGQKYSWDQLLASDERLGPQKYDWADVPEPPVAIPGETKIA
jgi:predicted dehydrogenase